MPRLLAAQAEAIASARDLALSADRDGFGKESRIVQIVDATGRIIDSVPVLGDGFGARQAKARLTWAICGAISARPHKPLSGSVR